MVTPRAARFDLLRVALLGNAPTKVDASGHSHKGALTGNKMPRHAPVRSRNRHRRVADRRDRAPQSRLLTFNCHRTLVTSCRAADYGGSRSPRKSEGAAQMPSAGT